MSNIKNVVWERTLIGEPMRYWTAKTEAEAEQVRQNYNDKYGAKMQLCTEEEWVRLRTEWNGFEPYEITAEAYYQLFNGVPPMRMSGNMFVVSEPHDDDKETGRPIHSMCYQENGKYYTKLIKL